MSLRLKPKKSKPGKHRVGLSCKFLPDGGVTLEACDGLRPELTKAMNEFVTQANAKHRPSRESPREVIEAFMGEVVNRMQRHISVLNVVTDCLNETRSMHVNAALTIQVAQTTYDMPVERAHYIAELISGIGGKRDLASAFTFREFLERRLEKLVPTDTIDGIMKDVENALARHEGRSSAPAMSFAGSMN